MTAPFTKFPNAVMFASEISIGAKVTYASLMHYSWRNGREKEVDPVDFPSLQAIAHSIAVSRTAVNGYMRELREVGLLVTSRVRNQGMRGLLFESVADGVVALTQRRAVLDSVIEPVRNPTQPGASLPLRGKELFKSEGAKAPSMPTLVLIDGQNVAMNALSKETSVKIDGSGGSRLAGALNGRRGQPGIREFFWRELVSWAEAHHQMGSLDEANGERFERALEAAISHKAAVYRDRMPGIILSPEALLKHWSDLEGLPKRRRAMTPDEVARFPG